MNIRNLITLSGITKEYQKTKTSIIALDHIDLEVVTGEFIAIMGPSGSGKSTLLNILGLLDAYDSGMYLLDDTPTNNLPDREMASIRNSHIGFVFQSFNLLPQRNALENISLPLYYQGWSFKERNNKALHFLDKLGIAKWAHHLPDELSGGQKQRVAIARALITNPQLILADEPTGALDSKTSGEIMDFLGEINQEGKTIILVTHEQEIASRAQRRISLKDGRIIKDTHRSKDKRRNETIVLQEPRTV